ncbi:hypothetical protein BJX66DRAFT_128582 [Aspergillus keveii]|uniref:Uncharacterized protein n=1 Tax=Aspergillus keveii TaxID=714993 RepID=A0ABR4GCG4_9EURO
MTITGGRRPARAPPRTAAHLLERTSCKSINNICTDSLPTSQNGHHYALQCVILASKEGNFTHSTFQIRHHATSSSRGSGLPSVLRQNHSWSPKTAKSGEARSGCLI